MQPGDDTEANFLVLCQQFDQALAEALALELEASMSDDPALLARLEAARSKIDDAKRAMFAFGACKRGWAP